MNLVLTGDGSHTIFVPDLQEHYHSTYGAIAESQHVFIDTGLGHLDSKGDLALLEIGFGTGLNALLTCIAAIDRQQKITYHTLEKLPVDHEIIDKLNYSSLLSRDFNPGMLFSRLHKARWDEYVSIHPHFKLHKIKADLVEFEPCFRYDLIYFDAFAPEKQPEMWSRKIFERLYNNLNEGGILTTYCVKGSVKRTLREVGFVVEKLPGPPGKREILRGTKKNLH